MTAQLKSPNMPLPLHVGREEFFEIVTASSEEATAVTWNFYDAGNRPVHPPGFDQKPESYEGVRIEANEHGVWLRPGSVPSYSQITIKGDVTLKNEKGVTWTETVEATVRFSYTWGGMAKAWYPYPANWDMPWDGDDGGRRALVLMWELISKLPDEIRSTAGGIPIVRTQHAHGPRGAFLGAHVAFIHDAIHISDTLVQNLNPLSPDVTDADVKLSAVVLHEMVHAVTYRKALWNLHHEFANIRHFLRSPTPPVIGALPAAAAAAPVVLLTLAKQLIAPADFVSGYADATGWELHSPLADVARFASPVAKAHDLVHWLVRIPSHGVIQDNPIRPNIATGFRDVGAWFGLRLRDAADQGQLVQLHKHVSQLEADLLMRLQELALAVDPADIAIKQKAADTADADLQQARAALQSAYEKGGFVSAYAASDTLEDIAETLTYLTFDAKHRSAANFRDLDANNPALKKRRDYLVDEGVFPKAWNTPYTVGSLYRGLELEDHLDKWLVYL
jgi:hypothetical protein